MFEKMISRLGVAKSAAEIKNILNEHSSEIGWKPVGGRENNFGLCNALSNNYDAMNELIINGSDSVADYLSSKNFFPDNIQTPNEVHEYVVKNDVRNADKLMFLFAQNMVGDKRKIITVSDSGTGIAAKDFEKTILSLGESNKVKNNRNLGGLNMGGSQINSKSDCNMIFSVCENDPDTIAFTLIMPMKEPDWKWHSFRYLTDNNGEIITISRSKLMQLSLIYAPPEVDKNNFLRVFENGIIIPLKHGLSRKVIGIDVAHFSKNSGIFHYVPNKHFGLSIPVHFVAEDSASKPIYNLIGTRNRLDALFGVNKHPFTTGLSKNLPKARISPTMIPVPGYGNVEVSAWFLEPYRDDKNNWIRAIDNFCWKNNQKIENIFCTRHGQTHGRLRSNIMLNRTKKPHIENHMIMEVNLDTISEITEIFVADRARLNDNFEHALSDALEKFINGQEIFAEMNAFFKAKNLSNNDEVNDEKKHLNMVSIMNDLLGGQFFGNVSSDIPTLGRKKGGKEQGNVPPEISPPIIQTTDNPSFIHIHTTTVVKNDTTWFKIRTDADDTFADKICILKKPEWLTVEKSKALCNGKMSILVKCADVPVDTSGIINVILTKNDNTFLTVSGNITVVEKSQSQPKKNNSDPANKSENRQPNIIHHWKDSLIAEHQESLSIEDVQVEQYKNVAFHYFDDGDEINVFLNASFEPFMRYMTSMTKRFGVEIADEFKSNYEASIKAASLGLIEFSKTYLDETPMPQIHARRSLDARTIIIALASQYEMGGSKYETKIELNQNSGTPKGNMPDIGYGQKVIQIQRNGIGIVSKK